MVMLLLVLVGVGVLRTMAMVARLVAGEKDWKW